MRGREKSSNLLEQFWWLSLEWGADVIRRFATKDQKYLVEMAMAAGAMGSNVSVGRILTEVL